MMTPFDYLLDGDYWSAFTTTYTSVMGAWFWVFIVFITDIAIALKSRNGVLVMIINILFAFVFGTLLPSGFQKVLLILSAVTLGGLFLAIFKREAVA